MPRYYGNAVDWSIFEEGRQQSLLQAEEMILQEEWTYNSAEQQMILLPARRPTEARKKPRANCMAVEIQLQVLVYGTCYQL